MLWESACLACLHPSLCGRICECPLRRASTGADKGHERLALWVERSPHLFEILQPSSRLKRSLGGPPGEMGEVLRACQLGWPRSRWPGSKVRGAALLTRPLEAFLSCFAPAPTPSAVPAPGPSTSHHLLAPRLFANFPHPDINECEEDGIACGPSQMCFNTRGSYQCVDTPCPATYRQGSSPG